MSATAVPRKVFFDAGFFPEGVRLGGDLDMWLRIALGHPMAFSTVVGASYFRNAESRICDTEYAAEGLCLAQTAAKAVEEKRLSARDSSLLKEYVNMKTIESAGRCIVIGDLRKARRMLWKCNTRLFWVKKVFFMIASFCPQWLVLLLRSIKKRRGMGSP
jgi:hypothetical protein